MGLGPILDRHYVPGDVFGIRNRQAFEAELEAYRKRYGALSLLILGCALALVAGAGYAALRFLDDPGKLKLVYAATGVTLAGAIETLRRVAREWGRVDLLLLWLKNADDEDAKGIIRDLNAAMSDPRRKARSAGAK